MTITSAVARKLNYLLLQYLNLSSHSKVNLERDQVIPVIVVFNDEAPQMMFKNLFLLFLSKHFKGELEFVERMKLEDMLISFIEYNLVAI